MVVAALAAIGWIFRVSARSTCRRADVRALDEQLTRLRRASDDPALLIGTAKEMLESVAKFVLEENGFPIDARMDFNGLWQLARERLGVLPQQVDQSIPGTSR
jgi:hypothetical protein